MRENHGFSFKNSCFMHFYNMKSDSHMKAVISDFYLRTYGSKNVATNKQFAAEKTVFDKYNLIKISRKSESLPPALRKALNYLYPIKKYDEIKPTSDYDRLVRKLSSNTLIINELSPVHTKKIRLKKLSLDDIYESKRGQFTNKSSSQEYINCIGYNGQAESEYMKTREGVDEYKKLYNLIMKDSGMYYDRIRPGKALRLRKRKNY